MGLFGVGGIAFEMERNKIQQALNYVGAYPCDDHQNCERCYHWVSAQRTGSNYFGGCTYHGVKCFASYTCENFDGSYRG